MKHSIIILKHFITDYQYIKIPLLNKEKLLHHLTLYDPDQKYKKDGVVTNNIIWYNMGSMDSCPQYRCFEMLGMKERIQYKIKNITTRIYTFTSKTKTKRFKRHE